MLNMNFIIKVILFVIFTPSIGGQYRMKEIVYGWNFLRESLHAISQSV